VNISCIVMADYSDYFQIFSPTKIAKFIDLEFRLEIRYCNVLVGSISQWNFIALKVQYTNVDYSQQLYNTRPLSPDFRTRLTSSLENSLSFITLPYP
jgi:hypothetical protein